MADTGSQRRVVVTGRGLVTPLGRSADEIWRRWASGACAAGPVRRFDATTLHARIACEVPEFHPRQELKSGRLARLLRPGEDFGYVAAGAAFADAGLAPGQFDSERTGIAIGCRKEGPRVENFFAGIKVALDENGRIDRKKFIADGVKLIPPQTIVEGLPNACMYYIAHDYAIEGVNYNFLALGSGGMMALGEGLRALRRHEADRMLAGGYDSWVNWVYLAQLSNRRLLTQNNDDPQRAHRPFDVDRDGSVAGEGAGLMILEDFHAAHRRGAAIHGELLGYAATTGVPHHEPGPCARLYADCISRALREAQCGPADIDFIHVTGDATPSGEDVEARAILDVFGSSGRAVPVTTLKSAVGHLGNASGSVEVAVMLESMRRGTLLPIVNLDRPDPSLPLAFVRSPQEGLSLDRGLMLSRGWPSHYTALVIGRLSSSAE